MSDMHWHDDEYGPCPCDEDIECVHDRSKADDLECPECGADLVLLDDAQGLTLRARTEPTSKETL